MTRLWSPASVKSVWSFCVSPALMPTRGWSSPRITTSVSRRSYHVRRLTIKTLFWLHSYCVAVTWTCRCFKLSSINLKYKVILGLIIRWSLDEMFVICMSYIINLVLQKYWRFLHQNQCSVISTSKSPWNCFVRHVIVPHAETANC